MRDFSFASFDDYFSGTAAGAGKNCNTDTIVDMTNSEVRNDFGKTGTINVSACANQGRIDITGAIIVDDGGIDYDIDF